MLAWLANEQWESTRHALIKVQSAPAGARARAGMRCSWAGTTRARATAVGFPASTSTRSSPSRRWRSAWWRWRWIRSSRCEAKWSSTRSAWTRRRAYASRRTHTRTASTSATTISPPFRYSWLVLKVVLVRKHDSIWGQLPGAGALRCCVGTSLFSLCSALPTCVHFFAGAYPRPQPALLLDRY